MVVGIENVIRMMLVILLICVINSIVCACSSAPADNRKGVSVAEGRHALPPQDGQDQGTVKKDWEFVPPRIPAALVSIDAKTEYLVKHFWENYDFADTVSVSNPELLEQTLVNYLSMLSETTDEATAGSYLRKLADDMRKDSIVYAWFDEKLEHYLYDPNSPMRNDEYYMAVLQGMVESGRYREVEKLRPEYRMRMLRKNRKGSKAADFSYTLEGGERGTLNGIKSDFTLLLLYDPECENCRRAINEMVQSPVIRDLTTLTDVVVRVPAKVLTICVEHDMESWKAHLAALPDHWLNGFDSGHQIRDRQLYDLRSFPSLYLLDSDKRVLLKDVNVQDVIGYFTEQSN
nr:DUF5106 domain-containing protein [Bacteroides acidifaciens]